MTDTVVQGYRLSPQQARALALAQATPELALGAACALRLRGALDPAALADAVRRVAARHEVLRTAFPAALPGREPVQVVQAEIRAELEVRDLSALPGLERAALESAAWGAAVRPAAGAGPLHAVLFRRAAGDHVLHLALPALCADAPTLDALVAGIGAAYVGDGADAAEPMQYVDFSEWLHETLESPEAAEGRAFWARQPLDDAAPLPELWPAPAAGTGTAAERIVAGAALAGRIDAAAAAQGVSAEAWLLAAWRVLLQRHAGDQGFALGIAADGRVFDELRGALGPFTRYLPVAGGVAGPATFAEVAARTERALADARAWQAFHAWPAGAHDIPRLRFGFDYAELPPQTGRWGAVEWSIDRRWHRTERFALRLSIERAGQSGEMRISLSYDAAWLHADGAARLLRRYAVLLDSSIAAAAASVDGLPLLDADERAEALGQRPVAASPAETLHRRFERRAAAAPDAVALTCDDDSLTYAELDARANRLARVLRRRGVGPESRVGLCLERGIDAVVGILAIVKAGGAYVPLDPAYPADRLAYVVEDAGIRVVLSEERLRDRVPASAEDVLLLDGERDAIAAEDGAALDGGAGMDSLAYVIYTSGSTGKPKGVQVTHANAMRLFESTDAWFGFGSDDVWTLFHSLAFDFSVWELWGALLFGGRLVVVPFLVSRSPADFRALLAREGVTVLNQTPSAFRQLIAADEAVQGEPALSLRYVVFGGEALEPGTLAAWVDRHGDAAPRLINMYGITETTVHVTWRPVTGDDVERGARSPVGIPIPDLAVHVLDGRMQPSPVGIAGEMFVGGAGVARGYLGRPALTAERFIPDPFGDAPGARLYRSGDRARRLPGGELEFLGRADEQVKVRGFRIEPGEIEAALLRHPAVADAAVVARQDDGTEKRLVGYVVPAAGAEPPAASELRALLSASLPDYMVPAAFVALPRLPLTPNGKLDRRALPAPVAVQSDDEYVAPRTPTEELLAGIWQDVLGVERVGIDDGFFALGGDSILSVRIVARAREAGLELEIADLFSDPTVRQLAERAALAAPDGAVLQAVLGRDRQPFDLLPGEDRAGLPEDAEDAYPLAALQAGMLYEQALNPGAPAYHNVHGYHFRGPFDEAAFRAAVQRAVDLHDNLRTSFHLRGFSEPVQVVHARARVPIGAEDIRHLPDEEQERHLEAFISAEYRQPLDLETAPLMRLYLHRRADDRFQLTLTECHAIADGWSTASLFADIFADYAALLRGEPLPERHAPPVRYRDFVEMERAATTSEASRRFWAERLEGLSAAPIARLPAAFRDPAAHGTESLTVPLSSELEAGLRGLARSLALPLKSVLLAAHMKVLATVTGRDDVVTGLPTNGRPEVAGGTDVRGLFLNVVPLRARLRGGSWADLAREMFRAEVDILPHRRYPHSLLQRDHGPARLLEVNFNLVRFHSFAGVVREGVVQLLGNRDRADTSHTLLTGAKLDPISGAIRSFGIQWHAGELTRDQGERLALYYRRVFEAMVADPSGRYEAFSPLSAAERDMVLTPPTLPAVACECLHHAFSRQARRDPAAPAVSCEGQTLTYGELERAAGRLASHLRARGVAAGDRIGLALERSPGLVVAILGVLKAGAAYVPLDPRAPAERNAFILSDAGVGVVIAGPAAAERMPEGVRVICPVRDRDAILAADEAGPAASASADGEAYVIYTSGSTGRPKGVAVTHASVARLFAATAEWVQAGPEDVWTLFHSYAFDFSVWEMWGALLHGGRLVVVPYWTARSPAELRVLLARERVTVLSQTPSAFHQLARADEAAADAGPLALRLVVFGGEALEPARLRGWMGRHGDERPRLVNMYGITETTVHVTARRVVRADAGAAARSPIGEPIADLGLYLLDPHGCPVPVGVPGEMYVGGAGVARGYLNRPALTAQRFVPDPFGAPGARLYRSGDLARRLPDGELEFLGRGDEQVKVRGFRVEPGEVEAALSAHPSVREAVVLALPDPAGGQRLAAYASLRQGDAGSSAELRTFLEQSLPDYMVPAAVMVLPELPLTINGKVDRRALPSPFGAAREGEGRRAAPATGTEARMAALWAELLALEQVGVDENFFDLGGHSLLLVQLQARVASDFARELRLVELVEHPTVRALAGLLDERTRERPVEDGEESGGTRRGAVDRRMEARRRRSVPPSAAGGGVPDDDTERDS